VGIAEQAKYQIIVKIKLNFERNSLANETKKWCYVAIIVKIGQYNCIYDQAVF